MHSIIFQVTQDKNYLDNQMDNEELFELMGGRADYVQDSDNSLLQDVENIFGVKGKLKKCKDLQVEYVEVTYPQIQKFISKAKADKLAYSKKKFEENLEPFFEYLKTGKNKNTIEMIAYYLKNAIEDIFDVYVFHDDFGLMTFDKAIYKLFENVKKGESVYFIKSSDYHF